MASDKKGAKPSASAVPPKTPHTLKINRGALHILRQVMSDPGPCTAPNKIVLWATIWDKLDKLNDRHITLSWLPEPVEWDKPLIAAEGLSASEQARQQNEFNEALEAWNNAPISLSLSDKHRDAIREAFNWIFKHKDDGKAQVRLVVTKHVALVLTELKLADEDTGEDGAYAPPETDEPEAQAASAASTN